MISTFYIVIGLIILINFFLNLVMAYMIFNHIHLCPCKKSYLYDVPPDTGPFGMDRYEDKEP